jgi:hypothetical protein
LQVTVRSGASHVKWSGGLQVATSCLGEVRGAVAYMVVSNKRDVVVAQPIAEAAAITCINKGKTGSTQHQSAWVAWVGAPAEGVTDSSAALWYL